jgi:hypothetical protein
MPASVTASLDVIDSDVTAVKTGAILKRRASFTTWHFSNDMVFKLLLLMRSPLSPWFVI